MATSCDGRIEWPPGSGVVVEYAPEERRTVLGLVGLCERGDIDEEQLRREFGLLHDAKVLLGASIRDVEGGELRVDPDSWFGGRVPAAALLARFDPQERLAVDDPDDE